MLRICLQAGKRLHRFICAAMSFLFKIAAQHNQMKGTDLSKNRYKIQQIREILMPAKLADLIANIQNPASQKLLPIKT